MKFSIKDISIKFDQIRRKLRIWSHLLEISLMENLIFCAVISSMKLCMLYHLLYVSRPEVFCKKGVFRNFTKFTGKHLCQSHFFNKVAGLKKETLAKVFSCEFCEISKISKFFTKHLWATDSVIWNSRVHLVTFDRYILNFFNNSRKKLKLPLAY